MKVSKPNTQGAPMYDDPYDSSDQDDCDFSPTPADDLHYVQLPPAIRVIYRARRVAEKTR